MALTVGTDSFATLVYVDAYWVALGNTEWDALDDATAEVNIRKGSLWLNRTFRMKGTPPLDQRLQLPAELVEDQYGRLLSNTAVPIQAQEATAIMADLYRQGTFDLEGILTDESAITLQKVDVITVEYDAASRLRGGAIISHVHELMRPITAGSGEGLVRA